jgi:arylsulfatase A-like enzyme
MALPLSCSPAKVKTATHTINQHVDLASKAILRHEGAMAPKPNLLVFLPDQHRADTLACYGARRAFAPNLDKLAAHSVICERAYVTQPICGPSRSSLLTGTWPHQSGCTQNNRPLPAHFRCLPELLDDSDYRTGYMGKWHLGNELSGQHGFEEWVSVMDGYKGKRDWLGRRRVSDYAKFLRRQGVKPDDKKRGIFSLRFAATLPLELSKPKFLELRACDFLERHQREPFILFVAFFEPHPPYFGPFDNVHPLDPVELDPSATRTFGQEMPLRYRLRQEFYEKRFGAGTDTYLSIRQRYLGLVTEMDLSIGAILTKVEQLNLAGNTIVVHTSDHGELAGAHRLFGKGVMFEEAARVPLLIRLPQQRGAISVAQPISHIDFTPTILDLLGKEPSEQFAGRSRACVLRGNREPAQPVFMQWAPARRAKFKEGTALGTTTEIERAMQESTRAIVTPDGWKLCLRDADKNELYNLGDDPHEMHNLYGRAEYRDETARLSAEIRRWQESVGDSLPL